MKGQKLSHTSKQSCQFWLVVNNELVHTIFHLKICTFVGQEQYYTNVLALPMCKLDGNEPNLKLDQVPNLDEISYNQRFYDYKRFF